MKLLWGSSIDNPVSYSGEHYRLEDANLSLLPVQKPHPPIYIGAFTSTKLFNLIGEMCQGWLPGNPNTEASFKRADYALDRGVLTGVTGEEEAIDELVLFDLVEGPGLSEEKEGSGSDLHSGIY